MNLTKKIEISDDVQDVLRRLEWIENGRCMVRIVEQLDHSMYERVNKVLEAAGGKWSRKDKAHVFPAGSNPQEALGLAVDSGFITVERDGFFETPMPVIEQMLHMADLKRYSQSILEPSAGRGAIAKVIRQRYPWHLIICVEKNEERARYLKEQGFSVRHCDFMEFQPLPMHDPDGDRYDRIIMNPPFENMQDVDHILHAFNHCLRSNGKLVGITSASPFFRDTPKAVAFRKLVHEHGFYEHLPEGSFKPSGTNVNACMVVMCKPGYDGY